MNTTTLLEELIAGFHQAGMTPPECIIDSVETRDAYEKQCQIFNTKFRLQPQVFFLVDNEDQVSKIIIFARQHADQITLRVRSGGHDHEGECSDTAAWVIDFSRMNSIDIRRRKYHRSIRKVLRIGPGVRFKDLKREMDKKGLGIGHGTCESVGVAGYTMGGGWGPWTRKYGMGYERLIGAKLVLWDGCCIEVNDKHRSDSKEGKLLWALRGGGGFSFGIVIELSFLPFQLTRNLYNFSLQFNNGQKSLKRKTIDILYQWERAVAGDKNAALVGSNLKIVAQHLPCGKMADPHAKLDSTLYGYYAGCEKGIRNLLKNFFGHFAPGALLIKPACRLYIAKKYRGEQACDFQFWDLCLAPAAAIAPTKLDPGIELEHRLAAPHKVTSRFANASGWNEQSRMALVCALQSPRVVPAPKNGYFGISQYITIGAMSGPFYHQQAQPSQGAFPYTDCPFWLQFQAWWGQNGVPATQAADSEQVNDLEEWIADCREACIPHTHGAFISFKDAAIPLETYFGCNLEALRAVKKICSHDANNRFRIPTGV